MNLIQIGLDPLLGYQEPEELTRKNTKDAFGKIKHHSVLRQDAKCFFQMGDVIYSLDALDEYFIYLYFYSVLDQLSKYFIHQSLVRCPLFFNPKSMTL